MKRRAGRVLSLLVVSLLAMCGLTLFAGAPTSFDGETMGTTYEVKFGNAYNTKSGRVETRLYQIEARMSTYLDDSEVSRFNRAPANEWFPVSKDTAAVVKRAQEISRETDGAFDITVGPLVRLWNFGAGSSDAKTTIPDPATIKAVRGVVGYNKLQVREEPPALRKMVAGLEIDLSAIAKGYAVDEVARILDKAALDRYMVEIGGEIRVRQGKGEGEGEGAWRVGIEAPIAGQRRLQSVFLVETGSVATSGDYRNFYEIDGKRYSHTIDPRTGRPVDHDLVSVTVHTPDCISADAYATALIVMGPTKGVQWADDHSIAAFLLRRRGETVFEQRTSRFNLEAEPMGPRSLEQESSFTGMWLVTVGVFAIAVFGMAIGVIVNNRRLKGSCGGLAGFTDDKGNSICDACTNPSPECRGPS